MSEAMTAAPESAPANTSMPETNTQANAPADNQPAQAANTEDTAASTPAGDEAAANADEPKKPKGVQKRIDELVRDREDAKRERDYWRQMAMGEKPKADAPAANAPKGEPRVEEFQTYEQYIEARTEWRVEQALAKDRAHAEQTKRQEQVAEHRKGFEADLKAAEERYPNFREAADLVLNDPDFPISPAMAEAVMYAEKRADLVYWLGNNPDEARRISRLAPYAAAAALGRIEATLSTPPKRTVTQAPPPPKTLKGGETPAKDPSKMTMDEYVAWRKTSG